MPTVGVEDLSFFCTDIVVAKDAAIDRFLNSTLIQAFFKREEVESEPIKRYLVGEGITILVKIAGAESIPEKIGVIQNLNDPGRLLGLINHTGFTHAYLLSLAREK